MGLALGTNLKFYTSLSKGLKLKVKRFCGLIPTFVKVTGENPSLIELNCGNIEIENIKFYHQNTPFFIFIYLFIYLFIHLGDGGIEKVLVSKKDLF